MFNTVTIFFMIVCYFFSLKYNFKSYSLPINYNNFAQSITLFNNLNKIYYSEFNDHLDLFP